MVVIVHEKLLDNIILLDIIRSQVNAVLLLQGIVRCRGVFLDRQQTDETRDEKAVVCIAVHRGRLWLTSSNVLISL